MWYMTVIGIGCALFGEGMMVLFLCTVHNPNWPQDLKKKIENRRNKKRGV